LSSPHPSPTTPPATTAGRRSPAPEADRFWHDRKGARLNAIRTRTLPAAADIVVARFGEKYKQWNAAFDAG
jgi:YtoQ family protein